MTITEEKIESNRIGLCDGELVIRSGELSPLTTIQLFPYPGPRPHRLEGGGDNVLAAQPKMAREIAIALLKHADWVGAQKEKREKRLGLLKNNKGAEHER